jgi:hypothetical protein
MKPVIRILGIVLSLSVLFSCHKPHDDASADPNATKLRISKVVRHLASQPADKSMAIDFEYDDQLRVEKLILSTGDESTGTLIVTPIDSFQYYYNGTEKNAFKASNSTPIIIGLGTEVTYFRFNNGGQVTNDSVTFTGNPSYSTREYTYAANIILVKKSSFYTGSGQSQLTDTFVIKDNNVAEVHYGNPSAAYNTTRCYKCTYDNKINPVSKLNFAALKPVDGIEGFPSYLAPGVSKNNIVEYSRGTINYQGKFIVEQTTALSYTYNSDGLPETCIMKTDQETYNVTYYYEANN